LLVASAVLVAGVGVGAVSAAAAAAPGGHPVVTGIGRIPAKHRPKIVAKPDSVMVNTKTTLTGSGFKRHKRLRIWECSARNWVVPKQICNHRNAVTVRTNAHGGFTVKFKALVCPANSSVALTTAALTPAARKGFSRRCFVGVPTPSGVDVVILVGAARITVTGP
jgi:hypothetical protein